MALCGAVVACLGVTVAGAQSPEARVAAASDCTSRVMNVVAHQDDDLVFFGAAEIADVAAGACVQTVYLTAGEEEIGVGDWLGRETGAVFAHETMAGVRHRPSLDEPLRIGGRKLAFRTLARNDRVSLVFLRLLGSAEVGQTGPSLKALWDGKADRLPTIEGAAADELSGDASYSRSELTATLYRLMARFRPDRIRIQNSSGTPADHPDHAAAALFAYEAAKAYAPRLDAPIGEVVVAYRGRETAGLAPNVAGEALARKTAAFSDYARFDRTVCADPLDCAAYRRDEASFSGYARWLSREYPVGAQADLFEAAEIRGSDGMCLIAVPGAEETIARMADCAANEGSRDLWTYDARSGRIALDDASSCLSTTGSSLGLEACDAASAAQRWSIRQDGEIVHRASGRCLTAPPATSPNAPAFVAVCAYAPRQLFGYGEEALRPVAHAIVSAGDKCLAADRVPGSRAQLKACAGAAASRWFLTPGGALRNGENGLCAAAIRGGADSVVRTRPCSPGSAGQTWRYDIATRELRNGDAGVCLDARGDGAEARACDGSRFQGWAIESD